MNTSNQHIGLAGLGLWGKNIFRNLYEMGVLPSACDYDEGFVANYKKRFPAVPDTSAMHYISSFEELLNNLDIRAIAIATPASIV